MGQIFPPQPITIDAMELARTRDRINELEEDLEHLQNLLVVIGFGINSLTFAERDYENSCLYILREYIKDLKESKLSEVSEKLDSLIKPQIIDGI